MRHGEPDWDLVDGDHWRGAANDLAPLTRLGEKQARQTADLLHRDAPSLVLSSPMTRALQTAALVATELSVALKVDMDLREWLPDDSYQWTSASEVLIAYKEMIGNGDVRPNDSCRWEPLAAVRARAVRVLKPYAMSDISVLVVCHEVLIHALTGEQRTAHAEVRRLHL